MPQHDRAHRDASYPAVAAFARSWIDATPLPAFLAELDTLPEGDAVAVTDAAAALLAQNGWVEDLLGRIVAAMRGSAYFEPPFVATQSDIQTGLVLLDDPRVGVSIGIAPVERLAAKKAAPRGQTAIVFPGYLSLFRVIRAGGARLRLWSAPPAGPSFTGDARCTFAGERHLRDGELLRIDGREQAFAVERASGDMILLQATMRTGAAPFLVEYDSATLDCIGVAAADEQASRIQMLASLIGMLEPSDGGPALALAAASPHGFVRWHAMREWLALDPPAALSTLEGMAADDPHPQVRAAARTTLARLQRKAA